MDFGTSLAHHDIKGDETTVQEQEDSTGTELDEPKHGEL